MMKAPTAALALALVSTAATADVLVIDDDRYYFEPAAPTLGYQIDIDDDGWARVITEARSDRGQPSTDCNQLEVMLGFDTASCGKMELSDLVRMKFEADSND